VSEYPQTRCISWRCDSVTDITTRFNLHIISMYYFPFLSILSLCFFPCFFLSFFITCSFLLLLNLVSLPSLPRFCTYFFFHVLFLSSSAYLLYSHIPYIFPSFPYIFFLPSVLYSFVFTYPFLSLTTTRRHCTNNLIVPLVVSSLGVRCTRQRLNYRHVASQIHIMNLSKDSRICVAMTCNSKVCHLHGLNASGEANESSVAGNSCFS